MNVAARITVVCALLLAGTSARGFEVKSEDFTEEQIGAKAFILLSTSSYKKPSIKPGKGMFAGVSALIRRVDSGNRVMQKQLVYGLDNRSWILISKESTPWFTGAQSSQASTRCDTTCPMVA